MAELDALIVKLEEWTRETADVHRDRQLADQVLLADGWQFEADDTFAGGFRWFRNIGVGILNASEASRPNPLIELSAAYALIPAGLSVTVLHSPSGVQATVYSAVEGGLAENGLSPEIAIAISIAALKAIRTKASLDAIEPGRPV